ncbi:hypothetical protein SLA2020_427940 [Shorea laevis]
MLPTDEPGSITVFHLQKCTQGFSDTNGILEHHVLHKKTMDLNPERVEIEVHFVERKGQRLRLKKQQGTSDVPRSMLQNLVDMALKRDCEEKFVGG